MKLHGVMFLGIFALFGSPAAGREVLDESVVESFLNEANPYVYTAVGQQYVAQARAEATAGEFDTRLGLRYDNKRYPVSDGVFTDVFVEKPTESGMEFLLGYRKAEGVQEYNNIKTGDEGEMRVGIKVPVFALFEGMNARKYRLRSASLEAVRSGYMASDNLRHLRFDVFSAYYTLLYSHQAVALESDILERARLRAAYVSGKVEAGALPAIERLEVRRQILNREQRLLEAETAYETQLGSFLRYLGVSRDTFETRYTLPPLPADTFGEPSYETALQHALEYRPDLKTLRYETDRLDLRNDYIAVEKYPRFNVALYGVHDFEYDNGFKVSVDMDFPIERRGYQGRKSEIQKGKRAVEEALLRKRTDIGVQLSNRLKSLRALRVNLKNAEEEIEVARQLEAAEIKKFRLGAGDLMLVNQRELVTLEARIRKLSYHLRLMLSGLEIQRETGGRIGAHALSAEEGVMQ